MELGILILHKTETIYYLTMISIVMGKPKISCCGNGSRIYRRLFISAVYQVVQFSVSGHKKICTSPPSFGIERGHMTFFDNEIWVEVKSVISRQKL